MSKSQERRLEVQRGDGIVFGGTQLVKCKECGTHVMEAALKHYQPPCPSCTEKDKKIKELEELLQSVIPDRCLPEEGGRE